MNTDPILPDDPRLTAYALDEMAADERVEFEKLLSADPAARQAVEEIRAAGTMFAAALESEAAGQPGAEAKAAIVAGGDPRMLDGGGTTAERVKRAKDRLNRPIRFPQFYYAVSGLAAACFAVFFVIWQQKQPEPVRAKQYVAVDLPAFKATELDAAAAAPVAEAPPVVTMGREVPAFKDEAQVGGAVADLSLVAQSGVPVALAETREGSQALAATTAGYAAPAPAPVDSYNQSAALSGSRFVARQQEMESARQPALAMKRAMAVAPAPAFNTEAYGHRQDNGYQRVGDHPLSTFAVDVDTAAYANVRRFLVGGQRPPADAVRIEELINYFPYGYAQPTGRVPFAANLEVAAAPWAPAHRLVRIGLKGREVSDATRPAANLVFLLDVSGSMQQPNKLPLVKQSLRLLVGKLRADDRVAIAVYAGSSGLALPSTPVSRPAEILEAIDRLEAGGSTNGALGIQLAYDIAKANFIAGGVNRVILATDGDFNVGTTSEGDLVRLVEEKAKSGVFLSVLGFGMGNLKDGTLEQIADKGNGNYAYIDSLAEAKKALVEQAGGTLVTIAQDVKIQVEFNPAQVAAYRLIGYENRLLAKEDFNNDAVDAGEIGAGHTVTALYEVVPAGAELPGVAPAVDDLKYQQTESGARKAGESGELLTVKLRYKEPAGAVSSKVEFVLRDTGARFEDASQDFKFAAAVAAFGMVLRDSPHKGSLTLAEVAAWGRAGTGSDAGGYRSEFLGLVERAQAVVQ
ncbi:von Willebrand factor [Lacunisphaera limnophila]|uniref:von Willebrand factor n=1 Tax=Lacunisphaera limnophila TaxID=1838286 RepID=A0A1D8AVA1_9BACT|nr:von Willebrand factor type A domain-containing protein [Lacunisphaera limnophila]AOS44813.1 von Willebrand factor [Lacunisphaera limnophila]